MPIKKLPTKDIAPEGIKPPSPSRVTVAPTEQPPKVVEQPVKATKIHAVAYVESNIPPVKVNTTPTVIKSEPKPTITEIADTKIIKVTPAKVETINMKVTINKLLDEQPVGINKYVTIAEHMDDQPIRIENGPSTRPITHTQTVTSTISKNIPIKSIPLTDSAWDSSPNTTTKTTDKNLFLSDYNGNTTTVKQTDTVVETTKQVEPPVIEKVLPSVDVNVEKVAVTEMTIDPKYFIPTIVDRKTIAQVFNFDYLSYLFFEVNINENLPSFYDAVDTIIREGRFERDEDPGEVTPENTIDTATMKLIFNQIWTMTKDAVDLSTSDISIKNLIGFYIYFNRKLGFLPILVQGTTLNEFFADMTLESILTKLSILGLYPVNGYNLFERLWNSFTYSVLENANRAEIKLSLREFISYDVNRNMDETYDGFPNKNDQLIITYKLDPSKWSDKKTFRSDSAAFKKFKELTTAYITSQGATTIKRYLLDLLPVQDYVGSDMTLNSSVFARKSILSVSTNVNPPNRQLWFTLQSFDDVFKVNRLDVNKSNIRRLFIEFSSSQGFPLDSVQENQYNDLWLSWVSYLNSKASSISSTLNISTDINHNYKEMYDQLVWLTNAKFIIQYLQNNNTFVSSVPPYTDGANYINVALLKVYQSLTVLKTQIQNVIEYIKQEEKRFSSSSIK